jgi:hypothetical protein
MFFVVWKGKGLWVVWSLAIGGIATALLFVGTDAIGANPPQWFKSLLGGSVIFILPGIFLLSLGLRARRQPPRTVVDPATGREKQVRTVHSLYWIPVQYWGALYVLVGAWLCAWRPS